MTLVLSNDDVDKLLTMPECIAVLEDAYIEMSAGRAVNRVRSDCLVPSTQQGAIYSLKSMDAVIPKLGVGAVRIDSDIVTWPKHGGNVRRVDGINFEVNRLAPRPERVRSVYDMQLDIAREVDVEMSVVLAQIRSPNAAVVPPERGSR